MTRPPVVLLWNRAAARGGGGDTRHKRAVAAVIMRCMEQPESTVHVRRSNDVSHSRARYTRDSERSRVSAAGAYPQLFAE